MSGRVEEPGRGADGRRDSTLLGRAGGTRSGRAVRNRLAEHGLLWTLLAARQRRAYEDGEPLTVKQRLWALVGLDEGLPGRSVTSRSDVCIEGFPRSANSFTVLAFRRWNPGVRVAHHMHAAFQVRRAVRLGVPCCVLVRSPLDAVVSVVLMDRGRISDEAGYRSYIHFHERVASMRAGIVICRFEDLTEDPSVAVKELNRRFGTSFAWRSMTRGDRDRLMAELKRRRRPPAGAPELAPVPSGEKERRKTELRARLARHPLLPEATAAYAALIEEGVAAR